MPLWASDLYRKSFARARHSSNLHPVHGSAQQGHVALRLPQRQARAPGAPPEPRGDRDLREQTLCLAPGEPAGLPSVAVLSSEERGPMAPFRRPRLAAPTPESTASTLLSTWAQQRHLPPINPSLNGEQVRKGTILGNFELTRKLGTFPSIPYKSHASDAQARASSRRSSSASSARTAPGSSPAKRSGRSGSSATRPCTRRSATLRGSIRKLGLSSASPMPRSCDSTTSSRARRTCTWF